MRRRRGRSIIADVIRLKGAASFATHCTEAELLMCTHFCHREERSDAAISLPEN